MKKKIFNIIKKYATLHHGYSGDVDENTLLKELGIDSLGWQEVLIIIEEKTNRLVLWDKIDWKNVETLGELCDQIKFE